MHRHIFSIILFWIFFFVVKGQDIKGFEKVDLGYLCDYSISYEIIQDSFGSIWAATEDGLLRYNSQQVFLYNKYKGLPPSFNNKIQNVFLDSRSQVWISSEGGLAYFDVEKNIFMAVAKSKDSPTYGYIYDIQEFDDQLWLGTFNGLWSISLDDGSLEAKQSDLREKAVQHLSTDGHSLCLSTAEGTFIKSSTSGVVRQVSAEQITGFLKTEAGYLTGSLSGHLVLMDFDWNPVRNVQRFGVPIRDMLSTGNGRYFIATDGKGIFQLNHGLDVVAQYEHDPNEPTSLPNNGIYDLLLGMRDNIWVASYGGGVVKNNIGDKPFSHIKHLPNSSQSLSNNFTRAIKKMQNGDTWFGTKEGISIQRADGTWTQFPSLVGPSGEKSIVLCFFEKNDHVWVGTYGQGAFKINKNNLTTVRYALQEAVGRRIGLDKVYVILEDRAGNVWFGGIGGKLTRIGPDGQAKEFPLEMLRVMAQSPDGAILAAGRQGVMLQQGDTFVPVEALNDRTAFDYSTINCAVFLSSEELAMGTNGEGLIFYDFSKKTYRQLNKSNGLPSDNVQGIIAMGDVYWVSTSRGLVRLMPIQGKRDFQISTFDERDGIANAGFNYGAYDQWDTHTLAFGTADGVVVADLRHIPMDEEPSKVIFEGIEVPETKGENQTRQISLYGNPNPKVELTHSQNFVKVTFAGINHLSSKRIRYSWKMDGATEQWSAPSTEHELNLANLSPGNYALRVKTVGNDGKYGEESILSLRVLSPWWASGWAYFVYGLLALGLALVVLHVARTFINKKNADEQISFYNNIAHELKTPLTILLNKLDASEGTAANAEDIKRTVHRMNALFDQLLNFNKVTSQFYQKQEVSAIDLDGHFQMIFNNFKSEIASKNLSLLFTNQYPHPVFYYKKDVLDKITYNLISNAVKYTGQGGSINVNLSEKDGELVSVITDNGIGIPKDQQKDILKRYYRARNAINSQMPGTGLGLMMVKNLLDIDQGSISFVSEQGLGTSFTVSLKNLVNQFKGTVPTETLAADLSEDGRESSTKPKVLVVEDNDELRIDMVEKLSEHFSIMAARNGKEAYEKARSRMPDLIITDLIMPEMDGNELCRTLQANEETNHIPIFMMTVLNDSGQKVESIKSGVNSYFVKPIDFPFLIAKINSVLEYKQKLREEFIKKTEVNKAAQFKDEREAEFVQDIEDFILSRIPHEDISVQDLCKHIGMSRTALYMKLKDIVDQSPQNFIITTKMNHARTLLLQGGKTIQEIAFLVGFNNPKYFSTSFKKQFGQSPSDFLKGLNPEG